MVNHLYTLLLNEPGDSRGPEEDYLDPNYQKVDLPAPLARIRDLLFPPTASRGMRVWLARQYAQLIRASGISDPLDPRSSMRFDGARFFYANRLGTPISIGDTAGWRLVMFGDYKVEVSDVSPSNLLSITAEKTAGNNISVSVADRIGLFGSSQNLALSGGVTDIAPIGRGLSVQVYGGPSLAPQPIPVGVSYVTGKFVDNNVLRLVGQPENVVYGVNFGSGSTVTTANGYKFTGSLEGWGSFVSGPPTSSVNFNNSGISTGDVSFDNVVNYGFASISGVIGPDNGYSGILLNGLTAGARYNALFIRADLRNSITAGDRSFTIRDAANHLSQAAQFRFTEPNIAGNPIPKPGAGYIMATFTATGATQLLGINGDGGCQMNGLLVAQVPGPIPPKASWQVAVGGQYNQDVPGIADYLKSHPDLPLQMFDFMRDSVPASWQAGWESEFNKLRSLAWLLLAYAGRIEALRNGGSIG